MIEFVVQYETLLYQVTIEKLIVQMMKNKKQYYQIKYYKTGDPIYPVKSVRQIFIIQSESPIQKVRKLIQEFYNQNPDCLCIWISEENINPAILKTNYVLHRDINCEIAYSFDQLRKILLYFLEHKSRRPILQFYEKNILYTVHIEDICALDQYKRKKTILYTKNCSYLITKSIQALKQLLPPYFEWISNTRIRNLNISEQKIKSKGRTYTYQQRQRALYMYYESYAKADIIRKFGMTISTLNRWINEDKNIKLEESKITVENLKKENMGLRFENKRLKHKYRTALEHYKLMREVKWTHITVTVKVGNL